MKTNDPPPTWNVSDKATSLRTYAEWLHVQAVDLFIQDKDHGHFLFLFADDGIASMNPVHTPDPEKLLTGVRRAVKEHNLYGVVAISGAWTYYPRRPWDHTAIQILHGEMGVADLKDDDKTEALMVRMESRDGDLLTWLNQIIRKGPDVTLGPARLFSRTQSLQTDNYFENTK